MLFACMFVPDLPAEAIVRAEPELRGQCVVVVEGTPPTLTVIAANDRARSAGVEPGMTNLQAAARLALAAKQARTSVHGVIRRRSLAQENAAHAALADCARAFSPRVEECGDDTVLLDLTGLERLFGPPQKMACELARRASELGLEVNVAVSTGLDSAICAARGFAGSTVIPSGKEADRLAPLPIDVLLQASARERAQEMLETLDRWGVRTFRAFASLPEIAIAERLGPEGVYLQTIARGEGSRTLAPAEATLCFEEAVELEYPVEDLEALAFVLNRLLEQLCARLSARALSTNELRLRLDLDDCPDRDVKEEDAKHGSERIGSDQNKRSEQANEWASYERSIRLPVPMLDAKTFLRLWQLELRAHAPAAPVTKIHLRAEPVHPRYTQGGLFLPTAPEPERLELTIARLAGVVRNKAEDQNSRKRVGKPQSTARKSRSEKTAFDTGKRGERGTHTALSNGVPGCEALPKEHGTKTRNNDVPAEEVQSSVHSFIRSSDDLRVGSPEIVDTHRPGAFRMKRFLPPSATSSRKVQREIGKMETRDQSPVREIGVTALRLFRPPLPITAQLQDGRPARINADAHKNQPTPTTIAGPVTSCAGPWRTSGEWWNESWSRDEWDISIETESGTVLCRVFRNVEDDSWSVEGVYD